MSFCHMPNSMQIQIVSIAFMCIWQAMKIYIIKTFHKNYFTSLLYFNIYINVNIESMSYYSLLNKNVYNI